VPATPDRPFTLPWHAEVFALAVHLNEQGLFSWEDWTGCFGANLANARQNQAKQDMTQTHQQSGLDGADDYYEVWLQTLIEMVRVKGDIEPAMIDRVEAEWRAAYLATPHGHPVRI
jgi:nitrile hydratase accessory protein